MMHEWLSTAISGDASRLPPLPPSGFEAQLRRPRRTETDETELTPRRAFEMLVSAACYLSLNPSADFFAALDAVQLLHTLSQALAADGVDSAEDLIWRGKQLRWERHWPRESRFAS